MSRLRGCQSSYSTPRGHARTVKPLVTDHVTGMSLPPRLPGAHSNFSLFIHVDAHAVSAGCVRKLGNTANVTLLIWHSPRGLVTSFRFLLRPQRTLFGLDLVLDVTVSSGFDKELIHPSSNATNRIYLSPKHLTVCVFLIHLHHCYLNFLFLRMAWMISLTCLGMMLFLSSSCKWEHLQMLFTVLISTWSYLIWEVSWCR